jgi:transmembrane sensor
MAMNRQEQDIGETARLWAIRAADPAFADWDGLTLWLEQDSAHLAAYETAQDEADWAAELLASKPAQQPPAPAWQPPVEAPRPPRRRWFGAAGAIAAALALVGGWSVMNRGSAPETIATAPGEHRTIELADGSRIVLNGGTRVTIDRDDPRKVALAQGEALFEIRHDAAHPFVVTAAGTQLLDAGTVFNVVAQGDTLDVAVAEGAVIYRPGSDQLRLNPGDALSRTGASAAPRLRRASPQSVGRWQSGELQYDGAPLDEVAGDLGRNIGRPVRAGDGTGKLRFSGTLILSGPPEQVLARAGPLLGVRFTPDKEGWTMSRADGP